MQDDGFPRAAIDATSHAWIVLRFAAASGPVFLAPDGTVPADDRKRDANFGAAWRLAMREEVPQVLIGKLYPGAWNAGGRNVVSLQRRSTCRRRRWAFNCTG